MNPSTSDTVRGDLDVHWDDSVATWGGVNGCTEANLFAAIVHVAEISGTEDVLLTCDTTDARRLWDPFYLALGPLDTRRGMTQWLLLAEVDAEIAYHLSRGTL